MEAFAFFRNLFSIPLAEVLAHGHHRQPAKPQRLVRFQHGIPAFALRASAWRAISSGIGVDRHTSVFQTEIERALLSCPSTFPSESGLPAETPHGRSNGRVPDSVRLGFLSATRTPVPVRASQIWLRRFNSAFASRSLQTAPHGLQTLTVKSRLLTGEKCLRPAIRCASTRSAWVARSACSIGSISHPW